MLWYSAGVGLRGVSMHPATTSAALKPPYHDSDLARAGFDPASREEHVSDDADLTLHSYLARNADSECPWHACVIVRGDGFDVAVVVPTTRDLDHLIEFLVPAGERSAPAQGPKIERSDLDAWVVWVNSDGTEGKGTQIPRAVCQLEATALRIARGADVQGSDGEILQVPVFKVHLDNMILKDWQRTLTYGPVSYARSTPDDLKAQAELGAEREARQRYRDVLSRAQELGLSEADIEILAQGEPRVSNKG